MTSGIITSWQIEVEKVETVTDFILYSWAPKSLRMVTAAMKLKDAFWKESYDKLKQQRHHFADKSPSHERYSFSSNHVGM